MSDSRQEYLKDSTISTMPVGMQAELAESLGQCPRPGCDMTLTRLSTPRPDGTAHVCVCCDVGAGKDCPHKVRGPAGPTGLSIPR